MELRQMEYKLLEEQDLELMLDFVDDENTKYNVDVLKKFIDNKNDFGKPQISRRARKDDRNPYSLRSRL